MDVRKEIRILLAEDNKINQRIASITFKQLDLKFDIANDGQEALEMYKLNGYDLIFMDIQMPVMDGLEATQLIRAYEKESASTRRVYIVALTANTISEKSEEYMESGMDYFMEKPFLKIKLDTFISQFGK